MGNAVKSLLNIKEGASNLLSFLHTNDVEHTLTAHLQIVMSFIVNYKEIIIGI